MTRVPPPASSPFPAGFTLETHESLPSTNSRALAALQAGGDRHWVQARMQSQGRGRHGRDWASPPGNLYASLGIFAPCPPAAAPRLGFVAGLALLRAILALAPELEGALRLKWPNDCLVAGRKCAGILIEGCLMPGGRQALAIGIGVNLASSPPALGNAAAALNEFAPVLAPDALLAALAMNMADLLAIFDDGGGFASIRAQWLACALPIGERLRVKPPGGERIGRFAGIDAQGHLLLATEQGIQTIMVGDVSLDPGEMAAKIVAESVE